MPNEKRINLFGRVSVRAAGSEFTDFTMTYAKSLLVFLALHPDIDHPRDRLIKALWPNKMDGSARNRLSVTLYHLKRSLTECDPDFEDAFVVARGAVRLDSSQVTIDLRDFRASVAHARESRDTDAKRQHYAQAIDVYGGPLAPEVVAEWTLSRQIESSLMFQEAAVWLATDLEAEGRHDQAAEVLTRALDKEPFSERATELLINWHMKAERFEEAAACARRLRRALAMYGQAPSRSVLERIEELQVILGRERATKPNDEDVVTILGFCGTEPGLFASIVEEYGGRLSQSGTTARFASPLKAMAAGCRIAQRVPGAKGFLYSSVMSWEDPVPKKFGSGLDFVQGSGLYGNEAFACLVREKNDAAVRYVAGRVWAVV